MLNDFYIFVGKIIPQISNLHCFGDPSMVGMNIGNMNVQGNCEAYDPVIFQYGDGDAINLSHESNQNNKTKT